MKKKFPIKYIAIVGSILLGIALIIFATIFFKNFLDNKFKPDLSKFSSNTSVASEEKDKTIPNNNIVSKNPTDSSKEETPKTSSKTASTESSQKAASETEVKLYQELIKGYSFKNDFIVPEFKALTYYDSVTEKVMPYRLFLPENYSPTKKYPVLLYLHGAGEIGNDNTTQLPNFTQSFLVAGDILKQAIIVCPQSAGWWYLDEGGYEKGYLAVAKRLLDNLISTYNGDTNRIYVTGLSMGGYGTWQMLERYGSYFAAAVPICGWGNSSAGEKFTSVPIWIYHGTDDPTVNFYNSVELYNDIVRKGGDMVQFTKLEGVEHNAWDYAFSDRKMFCWMFSQNRKSHLGNDYTYFPFFKIVAPNGKTIITDNDFTAAFAVSTTSKDYIEAYLTRDASSRLFDSYKSNIGKTYTVYCCSEKLYDYRITETQTEENSALESGIFLVEKAVGDNDFKSLLTIFTKTKKIIKTE